MSTSRSLIERVRTELDQQGVVREVAMFGGRAFMVNGKLVVSVGGDENLLVRVEPARAAELLAIDGALPAEMGGRSMGPSWMLVASGAVETDEGLSFWLGVALAYNQQLGARRRARPPRAQ